MSFWERITGSDLTREWKAFDARAEELPGDLRPAWGRIKACLMSYSDLSGRNLTPVFDGVLGLLETSAADGERASDVLGDDIEGFCAALVGDDGAGGARGADYRQRWRDQLNRNVARRLAKLEG